MGRMHRRAGAGGQVMATAAAALAILLPAAVVLPASAGAAPRGGDGSCNARKRSCPPPADTIAPDVRWSTPADGATVSGSLSLTGTASDDTAVAAVEVRVDGGAPVAASGTSAWSLTVDTRGLADGAHTATARATDTSGNSATATVGFTVANGGADTTAPTVSISTPGPGATVAGTVGVAGTAADGVGVTLVEVRVGSGPYQPAAGTTAWTRSVDTTGLADGAHTLTARVHDAAGNTSSTSVAVTVANGDGLVIRDPAARYDHYPLGRTRLPTWEDRTGVLYTELMTNRRVAFFRIAATGATAYVDLPSDGLAGWSAAAAQMTSATDLWVLGGTGPMTLRHYRLAGSPLPTSATLLETRTFGTSDSRPGDLLALAGGGLVAAWHQQGATGPEGQHVAYRSPAGAWSELPPLTFMSTRSSDQVLAQHPVDAGVWLFANPDAWGAVGAARMSESGGSLVVDWNDGTFIYSSRVGVYGPDPENPDLAAAADPATGTIALAYQSADRRWFSDGTRTVVGSRVAVARIAADRSLSFVLGDEYAERVSDIGLVVAGGDTVVSYRPVDQATLTYDRVHLARHRSGAWLPPTSLGTGTGDGVTYATGRGEFSTRMADGTIRLFTR